MRFLSLRLFIVACLMLLLNASLWSQAFVEYGNFANPDDAYGSHTRPASWAGGPSNVSVRLQADGTLLHDDGQGLSQRTARNTLNFTSPSSMDNPQDFDNLNVIDVYGSRLPLLQQMSASGTSTLIYEFAQPVNEGLDLFITDVDSDDSVLFRAFGSGNTPLDMTAWNLLGAGDLSLFKNTGLVFSPVIAPVPVTNFTTGSISLVAVDATNYNRSYSIFRAPASQSIERIEIDFTGTINSPNRVLAGNGSHIYVAIASVPEPATGLLGAVCLIAVCLRRRKQ